MTPPPVHTARACHRRSTPIAWLLAICGAMCQGCAQTRYVELRSVPHSPLVERLKLTSRGGPQPTARTMQILRQYDLVGELDKDPRSVVSKLQAIVDRQPSADKLYSLAELNYLGAKKMEGKNEAAALDMYGAAVAHAYLYLFDERFTPTRNPYDPEFRGACDVYNGALENAIRIVRKRGKLLPGSTHTIESESQRWTVTVVTKGGEWHPEDFDRFEFVSDYEVRGLANRFHSYGLGVPLIAVRKKHPSASPTEQFFPPEVSFPVTALLRVLPDEANGSGKAHHCVLELYDPLASSDILLAGRRVPLETDISTPLAFLLNDPRLESVATAGLLHPDRSQKTRGLYMLEPYQPGKIPVLMVHGLWSSPLTWMEMFNDLRSVPEIRDHYQFWFYEYPTGQPFWVSAAQLRQDLMRVRQALDPRQTEPALDQMVLVGHSMGGLLSKMQTVESGEEFWRTVSDYPLTGLTMPPEERQTLSQVYYFRPNPSIRRVITIATPHRGSDFANDTTRWLAQRLITLPEQLVKGQQELYRDNPGKLRDPSPIEVTTSIESLEPETPIFPVLLASPRPTWVKYHNIVGEVPEKGLLGKIAGRSDGIVSYESAHLDDVESELVVDADHLTVHRHPLSVLEVQRILLLHLDELRSFPHAPAPRWHTAAVPPSPAPQPVRPPG
ncbi:MAG: alpha/beta fold hydrolase [Planctomycetia bacterium]|nr:alpha/beta fold hydrolase [Planctomycetia bacterium]